jgi:CRP-like cAMP-binding protein
MSEFGDVLLHFAAAALVLSVLAGQMRRMRLLALGAGVLALAGFAVAGSAIGMAWSAIFAAASAVQLALMRARAKGGLAHDEEREMFAQIIRIEEPAQQRRLRDVLRWVDVSAGESLMQQGQADPHLIYVARGHAEIERDGQGIGECGPEDFLGEMSLVSGETASATVRAREDMRVAYFDRDSLIQLTRSVPEIARAVDAALNRSLAAKLVRMNRAAAER